MRRRYVTVLALAGLTLLALRISMSTVTNDAAPSSFRAETITHGVNEEVADALAASPTVPHIVIGTQLDVKEVISQSPSPAVSASPSASGAAKLQPVIAVPMPPDYEWRGMSRSHILNYFKDKKPQCSSERPALHVITYATQKPHDFDLFFCRSLISLFQNRVPFTLLNWGGHYTNLGDKLTHTLDFVKALPPCDLVLFVDAFDVLVNHSPDVILTKLLELDPDGSGGVLFSAECGCWPFIIQANGAHVCNNVFPRANSPYRYVNTGLWAGRAVALKDMLTYLNSVVPNLPDTNDQEIVNNFYITLFGETSGKFEGWYTPMRLDSEVAVFQTFHPVPASGCNPSDEFSFDANGQPHNSKTKTSPSLLHFNGGGKDTIHQVEHDELTRTEIDLGGGRSVTFADTGCGDAGKYLPMGARKGKW